MFDLNSKPGKLSSFILSLLPFLICIGLYVYASHVRHIENPNDKLVPSISQIIDGFERTALEPDRKGDYRLYLDTMASLERMGISMLFIFLGVIIGLYMGMFPIIDKCFFNFFVFFDKLPALALLPILFIVFGLGEV